MAGVLTRTQIEDEALDNVAKSGLLTLQSQTTLRTRMTAWVNRAQLVVARRADLLQFTASTSTIASQQQYSLPATIRSLYTLRLIDGLNSRKLTCIQPWEADRKIPYASSTTSAVPTLYVPYTQTLTFELFPLPSTVYTLTMRYSVYPTDFTSSSAVSQYTYLDDALVAYATMYAFRWLQELKDASVWEKVGDEIVDAAAEAYEEFTPDWSPASEGFGSGNNGLNGEYWNNPFVVDDRFGQWRG